MARRRRLRPAAGKVQADRWCPGIFQQDFFQRSGSAFAAAEQLGLQGKEAAHLHGLPGGGLVALVFKQLSDGAVR